MRKRHIKSVAHWVIMCFILLFPIVMVGISSFAQKQQEIFVTETYEYETNEITSRDDLIEGHIYKYEYAYTEIEYERMYASNIIKFTLNSVSNQTFYGVQVGVDTEDYYLRFQITTTAIYLQKTTTDNVTTQNLINVDASLYNKVTFYFVYVANEYNLYNLSHISSSDYLGAKTIDYTITDQTMRDDVNDWCASFRSLPVNQWYGDMLDTIGLGITTSMMMNVIYTYPLYVLWVYIIDLLVDCLLVIINFGHNALKRLGGENE